MRLVKRISKKTIILSMIILLAILAGGFFGITQSGRRILESQGATELPVQRSVSLNNYNNWTPPNSNSEDYQAKLNTLYQYDRVNMSEGYAYFSKLTPAILKAHNPGVKVYRLYDLSNKNKWDSDWNYDKPSGDLYLQTPLTYEEIQKNDWWLRDGSGQMVTEQDRNPDKVYFLDVGKSGFKEAFLKNTLSRLEGKGYDGIVLDYWWYKMMTRWLIRYNLPVPEVYQVPESEPDKDKFWNQKAWQPFINYVTAGLSQEGYEIIGNNIGEYETANSYEQWQRTKVDGVIYEQWAVGWRGEWLPGQVIEKRIEAFRRDPLEGWVADYGIRSNPTKDIDVTDSVQKAEVALAMYYLALPEDNSLREKKFFHYYKDASVFWDSLWDFNIGTPQESPLKIPDKSAWQRKYTKGLVLLNYSAEPLAFSLDPNLEYTDSQGNHYEQSVTLSAQSALILRPSRKTRAAPAPTPTLGSERPVSSSLMPSSEKTPEKTSTPATDDTATLPEPSEISATDPENPSQTSSQMITSSPTESSLESQAVANNTETFSSSSQAKESPTKANKSFSKLLFILSLGLLTLVLGFYLLRWLKNSRK